MGGKDRGHISRSLQVIWQYRYLVLTGIRYSKFQSFNGKGKKQKKSTPLEGFDFCQDPKLNVSTMAREGCIKPWCSRLVPQFYEESRVITYLYNAPHAMAAFIQ